MELTYGPATSDKGSYHIQRRPMGLRAQERELNDQKDDRKPISSLAKYTSGWRVARAGRGGQRARKRLRTQRSLVSYGAG